VYAHLVSAAGLGLSHELARKLLASSVSDRKQRASPVVDHSGEVVSWWPLDGWCLGVFKLDDHVKVAFAVSEAFAASASSSMKSSGNNVPINVETVRRVFSTLPLPGVLPA